MGRGFLTRAGASSRDALATGRDAGAPRIASLRPSVPISDGARANARTAKCFELFKPAGSRATVELAAVLPTRRWPAGGRAHRQGQMLTASSCSAGAGSRAPSSLQPSVPAKRLPAGDRAHRRGQMLRASSCSGQARPGRFRSSLQPSLPTNDGPRVNAHTARARCLRLQAVRPGVQESPVATRATAHVIPVPAAVGPELRTWQVTDC
jgi:hypothetical protein